MVQNLFVSLSINSSQNNFNMSGTSKFITAQVGAKLVTIELGAVNPHGNRKFKADMFGAVGALINSTKEGYLLMVELQELEKKYWYWTCWGSTISQCTDQFFAELRYQNERLEAAQIDTAQPPADLFCDGADSPTRDDYELNNHEANRANW